MYFDDVYKSINPFLPKEPYVLWIYRNPIFLSWITQYCWDIWYNNVYEKPKSTSSLNHRKNKYLFDIFCIFALVLTTSIFYHFLIFVFKKCIESLKFTAWGEIWQLCFALNLMKQVNQYLEQIVMSKKNFLNNFRFMIYDQYDNTHHRKILMN